MGAFGTGGDDEQSILFNPATINDRGGAKILGDSVQHIGKIKGLRRDRSLLF